MGSVVGEVTMKRCVLGGLVVALIGGASLIGCAGELENPERFTNPRLVSNECNMDVIADVIEPRCGASGCHSASDSVDLVSDDASRLLSITSTATGCEGAPMIDPQDPTASLIYHKLFPDPSCGLQMPFGADELSDQEKTCILDWVTEVGRMAPMGGDAGTSMSDGGM
jgi:hypothetical protein